MDLYTTTLISPGFIQSGESLCGARYLRPFCLGKPPHPSGPLVVDTAHIVPRNENPNPENHRSIPFSTGFFILLSIFVNSMQVHSWLSLLALRRWYPYC